MSNDFVHLHVHSEYSLLDGLGRVKKLVAEAKRLGQPALALTDHGTMHGAIEFFRACKAADIKPIIGVEAYQTLWGRPMGGRDAQYDRENHHLLLLARNMTGYRNLLKIASRSQLDGYYYSPRVDHEFLAAHAKGLIGTTGCLGAEVPQLLSQGKEKEAYERLGWYVEIFGKENFFIELQEHDIPELIEVNKMLVPWADKFDIKLVATNDVHYVREEDASPHDVLLCVQTSARIDDEKRMRMTDASYFLKSRAQMEETFRPLIDLPASAFDNTLKIAEMCEVDLEDKEFHLPDLPIPDGYNYETYLRHLTEEGLAPALRRPRQRQRRAGAQGARAAHHPRDGLRRLLPDRGRSLRLCAQPQHLVERARFGRRLAGGLLHRHHRPGSAQEQPDLRALPQPGPRHHARLRPGLSRRPARGDDPLHGREVRRSRWPRSSPLGA